MNVEYDLNHDRLPNVTLVQHFCSGFDNAIFVSFFSWFQISLKKINSVMCIYSNLNTEKVLLENMIMFSPISG